MHGVQNLEKFQALPDGTHETDTIKQWRTKFQSHKNGGGYDGVFILAKYVRLEAQEHKKRKEIIEMPTSVKCLPAFGNIVITAFQTGEEYCDLV